MHTSALQADVLKESVPAVVDMLADTVLHPKFLPWELEEEKAAVKAELDAAAKNPQVPQTQVHGGARLKFSTTPRPSRSSPAALLPCRALWPNIPPLARRSC